MLTSRRVDVERSPITIKSSAGIAQLVERNLAKVEVASSNLVSRSTLCWLSLTAFYPVLRSPF